MNNKFLVALLLNISFSGLLFADECKYSVKKKDGGYTVVKDCAKSEKVDSLKSKPIESEPYKVIKEFDNLGTEEISDDLYSERIFEPDLKKVYPNVTDKKEVKKEIKIEDKKEDLSSDMQIESDKESQSGNLPEKDQDKNSELKKEIKIESQVKLKDSSPDSLQGQLKKIFEDAEKKESKVNVKQVEIKKDESREGVLYKLDDFFSKFTKKFKTSKRVDGAIGYYQLNALDIKTNGKLKVQGGSNRFDYSFILDMDKWFVEFGAGLDTVMVSNQTGFKMLNKSEMLLGGKVRFGYLMLEEKVGASLGRKEVAVMGRFGRDPKKDIVITAIPNNFISLFYEHSFNNLFEAKFEAGYLFGGENEHFLMKDGSVISFEASKELFRDKSMAFRGGVIFEGSSYKTDGVDNKDSRVLGKFSIEW